MGEIHRLENGWVTNPCGFESYHFRMMIITATPISKEDAEEHEVDCDSVDHAQILAAEAAKSDTFDGCSLLPEYSVAFKPAEDMVIPVFLCGPHFRALRISLHEGVGVDEDVFGEFPDH